MIRMKTVKMTIIVASSALPMLPNATTEMYIVRIRNKKKRVMTMRVIRRMMTDHRSILCVTNAA